ncbi:large-conductance mechanosensitive channel protein MscL [Rurimicrobium arvi]|uniref:Large-conductance mechanosensitive channel n=1 Tax=Rurimicrobium arvi TaxID=2049916 RepID=A0ABP8MFU6_9BACT
MGFLKEFREFAVKGNVVDLAVGVIIGGAFGKIVTSLVSDIMMPLIGTLTGGVDFKKLKYVITPGTPEIAATATSPAVPAVPENAILYGSFIQNVFDFLIIALCIFAMVKAINAMKRKEEAAPAAPPAPSPTETLLTEIRDLLKK